MCNQILRTTTEFFSIKVRTISGMRRTKNINHVSVSALHVCNIFKSYSSLSLFAF